jgi:hypothetical protein
MPEITNPYDAVIADLEARRAEVDSAINLMKRLKESVSTWGGIQVPIGSGTLTETQVAESENIPSDAFFGLTIADAAVRFLDKWANRKPQATNVIVEALERGGQKRSKYTTVYGILSRRAKKEGDVVNVKGDWALAEWYGGGTKSPKRRNSLSFPKSALTPTADKTPAEANGDIEQKALHAADLERTAAGMNE